MKRATHLLLGAAAAIPVAITLSPGLALGAAWWGMVGGGFPDWFDLRSEFRRSLRLRHRGASHGLPFAIAMVVGLYLLLQILHATPFTLGDISIAVPAGAIRPWTFAFALGILSHLVADAWTHAGIRPFLPFSSVRVWVVPRLLRGKSSGPIDFLARYIAMTAILMGILAYLWLRAT
jgi:membrane-bound metal-dependent hydrolase YbcI (DUF457 family)